VAVGEPARPLTAPRLWVWSLGRAHRDGASPNYSVHGRSPRQGAGVLEDVVAKSLCAQKQGLRCAVVILDLALWLEVQARGLSQNSEQRCELHRVSSGRALRRARLLLWNPLCRVQQACA